MGLTQYLILALAFTTGSAALAQEATQEITLPPKPGEVIEDNSTDATPFEQAIALQCTFTHECFDGEACLETSFDPELTGKAGGVDTAAMLVEAMMISEAGDTPLVGIIDNGALSLSGGGVDARHLLTIAASGDSRYTVHFMDGPMMISYYGRCD